MFCSFLLFRMLYCRSCHLLSSTGTQTEEEHIGKPQCKSTKLQKNPLLLKEDSNVHVMHEWSTLQLHWLFTTSGRWHSWETIWVFHSRFPYSYKVGNIANKRHTQRNVSSGDWPQDFLWLLWRLFDCANLTYDCLLNLKKISSIKSRLEKKRS